MKKYLFIALSLLFVMHACEELEDPFEEGGDPFINIEQSAIDVSNEGGSKSVTFSTNVSWTASVSDDWCGVSPASGDKGEMTLTITIDRNEGFEERSCTVTVKGDTITKTVTVSQGENLGFLVSQDRYELGYEETTIEVIVSANVSFEVMVSDDWIGDLSARGVTESKLEFLIAGNDTYKDRQGTITIKELDGEQEEVVTIVQSKENVIILSEKEVEVSSDSHSIDVKYKTNVDIDVVIAEDAAEWVSIATTRGLRDEVLSLDIAANSAMKLRTAVIIIKDKNSSLVDKLTITQLGVPTEGVVVVEEEGTLGSILTQADKDTITTLVLQGVINEADFEVMKNEMPNLKHVDLTNVTCRDNKIPDFAFGAMGNWDDIGSVSTGSFAELKPTVRKRTTSVSGANTTITTVLLPKNITDIGNYAFAGCWGLTGELVIPEGVTTIGEYAFAECYSLQALTLPNSLITIKKGAFVFCDGFTASLLLPENLTSIGAKAFFGCSQFTGELVIPTGVTVIEDHVFDMCFGFTSLKLHDDITKIGYASFNECHELTGGLHLSDKITEIGEAAFRMCDNLSGSITLPSGLIEISDYTFAGCFNLSGDLVIPEGVTTIGEAAFNTCRSFTSLTLPESLTVIEARVFDYCDGLTGSLVIPKNVVSIGFWAFYGCEGLTGLTFAEGSVLNSISWSAFDECKNLTGEVFFPGTLRLMEMGAFKGCENVEAFKFPHAEPIVYSDEMLPVVVTVKVPSGAVANYRGTDGWKEHTIVGY